ncbi:MAG: SDR family NAD(P)-dependent oxidoreductase [Novosphingobium sp.]|nr:SDR family NAD(P)-dependent oxidoreductase [Novosphingobium sp.]
MSEYRFDGQTAIVTGGGGNPSLGRAHALLLASRGANVVVNDIGSDPEMRHYPGSASAEAVAAEIRAAGGNAVANTDTVATVEGAQAIVQTALDAFGSVDILVNNAAISIGAPFNVMTPRDFERHINVNLMGTVWTCRAAWPHMKARGYGRIVNTTSASMTGFAEQTAYCTSKGAVWSLTRSLASEGAAHGIKVNAVSPGAFTRLVSSMLEQDSPLLQHSRENLPPELSSPGVAWLCHADCPVTGECIDSVGGELQRTYIRRTRGFSDRDVTIETVAQRWDEIMDEAGAETVGIGMMDTSGWKIRPYEAED